MKSFQIRINADIPFDNIVNLYDDAGWTTYTSDKQKLEKAINNSLITISAWNDNQLVGFLRAVGDGHTIIYIQDILVLKSFRRQGIGRKILKSIFDKYFDVRQIVLMTDANETTISFYESCGLTKSQNKKIANFYKVNKLN